MEAKHKSKETSLATFCKALAAEARVAEEPNVKNSWASPVERVAERGWEPVGVFMCSVGKAILPTSCSQPE